MTQYTKSVEDAKLRIEAEEWANGVVAVHAHSLSSMYYDNRPEDTAVKSVIDVEYNSGVIKRYQDEKLLYMFGNELKGDELITRYMKTKV